MSDLFLQYVVPAAGVATANFMSFAAYRDVRKATLSSELGELNPTPWAFMLGNCFGWIAYSFLTTNGFVFLANAPGFLLSVWLNMAAVKLQFENYRSKYMRQYILEGLARKLQSPSITKMARKQRRANIAMENELEGAYFPHTHNYLLDPDVDRNGHEGDDDDDDEDKNHWANVLADFGRIVWMVYTEEKPAPAPHERLVMWVVAFWGTILTILAFGPFDAATRELAVGIAVNLNLIFVYGAPLSTVLTVLQTKSAKSIHAPTMFMNTTNSAFWTVYGAAVLNPYILVPNGLGTLLGFSQIVMYLLYPSKNVHIRDGYDEIPPPPPPNSDGSGSSTSKNNMPTSKKFSSSSLSSDSTVLLMEEEKIAVNEAAPLIIGPVPATVAVDHYAIV